MAQAMIDYQREIENQQTTQQMETGKKSDLQKHLSTFCPAESQPDPDFFQDDNDNKERKKIVQYHQGHSEK